MGCLLEASIRRDLQCQHKRQDDSCVTMTDRLKLQMDAHTKQLSDYLERVLVNLPR